MYKNPGPVYKIVNPYIDKFKHTPTWRIGSAMRKPLTDNENYEYYKHNDHQPFIDRSNNIYKQTKWTKIKGGAIGVDAKVSLKNIKNKGFISKECKSSNSRPREI